MSKEKFTLKTLKEKVREATPQVVLDAGSKVVNGAKQVGHATKEVVHHAPQKMHDAGKAALNGVRQIGNATVELAVDLGKATGNGIKHAYKVVRKSGETTVNFFAEIHKDSAAITVQNENGTEFVLKLAIKDEHSVLVRNTLHLTMDEAGLKYETLKPDGEPVLDGFISNADLGYQIVPGKTTIEDLSKPENIDVFFNIYNHVDKEGHLYKHTSRQEIVLTGVAKDKIAEKEYQAHQTETVLKAIEAQEKLEEEEKKKQETEQVSSSGFNVSPATTNQTPLPIPDLPLPMNNPNSELYSTILGDGGSSLPPSYLPPPLDNLPSDVSSLRFAQETNSTMYSVITEELPTITLTEAVTVKLNQTNRHSLFPPKEKSTEGCQSWSCFSALYQLLIYLISCFCCGCSTVDDEDQSVKQRHTIQ